MNKETRIPKRTH